MIDRRGDAKLDVFVVWEPVLDGDDRDAACDSSRIFEGAGVRQFWDPEHSLVLAVRDTVAIAPSPIAWDIYCFYEPVASFATSAPSPIEWCHQLSRAPRDRFRGGRIHAALDELVDRVVPPSASER